MTETTALGAALAAGLAVSFWESLDAAVDSVQKGVTFQSFKPTATVDEQQKVRIQIESIYFLFSEE